MDQGTENQKRTRQPKAPITEIGAMARIEKLLEPFTDAQKRRIAFVFAEQFGLRYQVPVSGISE